MSLPLSRRSWPRPCASTHASLLCPKADPDPTEAVVANAASATSDSPIRRKRDFVSIVAPWLNAARLEDLLRALEVKWRIARRRRRRRLRGLYRRARGGPRHALGAGCAPLRWSRRHG